MNNPIFANYLDRPAYDVLGDRYVLLLSSQETGGAYSLFDFFVPKGHGSPPHIHSLEDESFYILSGEVQFNIDQKVIIAKSGDVVFGPRGIAHNFTGLSEEPARMLCMASPGGFENFFAAIGKVAEDRSLAPSPPTEEDFKKVSEVAPKFGLKLLA